MKKVLIISFALSLYATSAQAGCVPVVSEGRATSTAAGNGGSNEAPCVRPSQAGRTLGQMDRMRVATSYNRRMHGGVLTEGQRRRADAMLGHEN